MSPAAQYVSVATLTFAVLGFQLVALVLLGVTAALVLAGFVSLEPRRRVVDEHEEEHRIPTPMEAREEAERRDG